MKKKKVFVAMSGGVDSSVAAVLLKEQGYDVVGVTMCFSISHPNSKKPSCCGMEGIADAKRVAQFLDIPHYVLDFASEIDQYVIEDFVDEYLKGRTPNPCVRCNQYLKFDILYKKVRALGADYLATGHYVRLECDGDKNYLLKKAVDSFKDQSYFLYSIHRASLPYLLFPLGGMTKDEARQAARRYQLPTAEKQESQDICFVPDEGGYKKFIENRVGDEAFIPGDFVNDEGEVVGQHKGIARYTIGQRDKLGIALGVAVYVYEIDKQTNTVYVGSKECLYAKGLLAGQFNFLGCDFPKKTIEVTARVRYNSLEVRGDLTILDHTHICMDFKDPQKAVTPGQSVVFYDNDVVLGGAIIDKKF